MDVESASAVYFAITLAPHEYFDQTGIKPIQLPARSPNLNAYAERWVRSAKEECLSKLILFGEASLRRALTAFLDHYHQERNHQGLASG